MKLHLPVALLAAVLGACVFTAPATAKTLHVYVLTGQSNSLGAVKGSPASPELLEQYSTANTSNIQMWNGNYRKGNGTLYVTNPEWQTVAPQEPGDTIDVGTGDGKYANPCMGPEYGFSYMMTKKGWQVNEDSSIAIVKSSLDGGGNSYWLKTNNFYKQILSTVTNALNALDSSEYDSIELSGLLYLQGESNNDSEATASATRYTELLGNLKADLAAQGYDEDILDKLTVNLGSSVVGQPATWTGDLPDGGSTATTITAKNLYALSESREDIGWVFTRDLTKITSGDTMGVHYDGKSQITIGARYAYAMALTQGWDVGNVRSDYYNNWDYNGAQVSLNDANAWWSGQLPDANAVVSWDVSSANQEDTLSGDFAVGGIKIEDPFRDTVVIKNLNSNTNATLSIGASGITLEGSNLSLQTQVAATADQTWNIAAGKTLSLTNTLDAAGRTISLAGGEGASVVLGGNAQIGALQMGDGAVALHIGNADAIGNVTIDTLSLGASASIGLSIVGEEASSLNIGQFNYTSDSSTITFTLDNQLAPSDPFNPPEYSFTIGTGWDDWDINGTGARNILYDGDYYGWTLTNNNGTLTLTSPTRSQQVVDASHVSADVYDVSKVAGATSGYVAALVNERSATGTLYIYACNQADYSGNVYAEIQDVSATWLVAVGKGSYGNVLMDVSGSFNLKVSASGEGAPAVSYTSIFGACNAAVDGDIYMEFDNPNATYNNGQYGCISGAYNSQVDNVTILFKSGTVQGDITGISTNSTLNGTSTITITGGTVQGNIYGKSSMSIGGTVNLQDLGADSSFAQYNGSIQAGNINITNSTVTAGSIALNNGTLAVDANSSLDIAGDLRVYSTGSAKLSGSGHVETNSLTVTSSGSSILEIGVDSLTVRGEGTSQVAGKMKMTAGTHTFNNVAFTTTVNQGINVAGGTTTFNACSFGNTVQPLKIPLPMPFSGSPLAATPSWGMAPLPMAMPLLPQAPRWKSLLAPK